MGSRLNIQINEKGTTLTNCYYHWGAYTSTGIKLTYQIIDKIINDKIVSSIIPKNINFDNNYAVDLLKNTGATLIYEDNADRSNGLISSNVVECAKVVDCAEYTIQIDISKETINFGLIHEYKNIEDMEDGWPDQVKNLKYKSICSDYTDIKFENFRNIGDEILELIKNNVYCYKENEKLLSFVE